MEQTSAHMYMAMNHVSSKRAPWKSAASASSRASSARPLSIKRERRCRVPGREAVRFAGALQRPLDDLAKPALEVANLAQLSDKRRPQRRPRRMRSATSCASIAHCSEA